MSIDSEGFSIKISFESFFFFEVFSWILSSIKCINIALKKKEERNISLTYRTCWLDVANWCFISPATFNEYSFFPSIPNRFALVSLPLFFRVTLFVIGISQSPKNIIELLFGVLLTPPRDAIIALSLFTVIVVLRNACCLSFWVLTLTLTLLPLESLSLCILIRLCEPLA